MEYITYILIILGMMGICLLVFRRKDDPSGTSAGRHRVTSTAKSGKSATVPGTGSLPKANLNVPTPWGWPGYDPLVRAGEDHNMSESLHRFVDHLLSEKQTIENREYLLKRNEGLRLLMEDRYGLSRASVAANESSRKGSTGSGKSSFIIDRTPLREIRTPWGW
jgi:hypothetical protein